MVWCLFHFFEIFCTGQIITSCSEKIRLFHVVYTRLAEFLLIIFYCPTGKLTDLQDKVHQDNINNIK